PHRARRISGDRFPGVGAAAAGGRRSRRGGGVMKGRLLVWPLMAVLALALAGQTVRWRSRMQAGRLLAQVETLTMVAARQGKAPRGLLQANLEALRRAAILDPVEVGIPIARGSQHLLFGSTDAAIEAYRA